MGGKMFKQMAVFCGRVVGSKVPATQRTPKSLPEDRIKFQEKLNLNETSILGRELQVASTISEGNAKRAEQKDVQGNHKDGELLIDNNSYKEDFESVSEFIQSPNASQQTLPSESTIKAPLGSRFPEIFSFEGRAGEFCSALSLTNLTVARWNVIFRCESQMEGYMDELKLIEQEQKRVTHFIEDITLRLQAAIRKDPTFDKSDELQIIDDAKKIDCEFRERQEIVVRKFGRAEEEMLLSRKYLFTNLKELFEENDLLEPTPEDSNDGSIASNPIEAGQESETRITATSSEIAAYAVEDAKEAAVEVMYEKERRVHDFHHKLDNWVGYYEAELGAYCKCVDDGQMAPARTMFDNELLREHQEATRELIKAEHEFEGARRLARELGAGINESDQESDFPDHVDDGYRESMEAAIIEQVDRDRIEQWMDKDQDMPFPSTECDAWESRTIDLCDSVSVVAEGKERKRIDRWRSVCELIEVDVSKP